VLRKLGRVHTDAAFGPAEGDIDAGALERHEHSQGAHFVNVHVGVVADAAFGRPARRRVLHAVALEGHDAAIVADNGQGDRHLDLGLAHDGGDALVKLQALKGCVEQGECGG